MTNFVNNKNLERLVRLDKIRLLKLLEILQFSIISFSLGLFIGNYINDLFPKFDARQNKYTILLEMSVLIIVSYYIKKLASIVPFCCGSFSKKYVPSLHNENSIGMTMGLTFVFITTQTNLKNKIKYLTKHFI